MSIFRSRFAQTTTLKVWAVETLIYCLAAPVVVTLVHLLGGVFPWGTIVWCAVYFPFYFSVYGERLHDWLTVKLTK
jgi:hypothetical protein